MVRGQDQPQWSSCHVKKKGPWVYRGEKNGWTVDYVLQVKWQPCPGDFCFVQYHEKASKCSRFCYFEGGEKFG